MIFGLGLLKTKEFGLSALNMILLGKILNFQSIKVIDEKMAFCIPS